MSWKRLKNEWLLLYPEEELGPPKGLILLMAVFQQNKSKVRPVLNFRELSGYVDAYTAHAGVLCTKIKRVEKEGLQRVSARPPKGVFASACAQIFVAVPDSYPRRKEVLGFRRKEVLGFGLNVAPSIMRAIVEATLLKDDAVRQATLAYIDDVFINEDIASATRVR